MEEFLDAANMQAKFEEGWNRFLQKHYTDCITLALYTSRTPNQFELEEICHLVKVATSDFNIPDHWIFAGLNRTNSEARAQRQAGILQILDELTNPEDLTQ